jgi:hypothetical protein
MDNTLDLLQLKIEKAKKDLPPDTVSAISAVPWQATILKMRETKGYTFEQLGALEIETELLLCGLLSREEYPKELEKRMGLTQAGTNDLLSEMNEQVFKRVKEELIKITENKKSSLKKETRETVPSLERLEEKVLSSAGIEILEEKPAFQTVSAKQAIPSEPTVLHPILTQKLSSPVQTENIKTEHSPVAGQAPESAPAYPKGRDPYRLPPI